jgi:hypothetical protein
MRVLTACASAILFVLTGCSRPSWRGVRIDRKVESFIGADTKALAGLDVNGLKRSGVYQRHQKDLQFPLLDASSERLGVDPRHDIEKVLVVVDGSQPLFIISGSFQTTSLEQKVGPSLGLRRGSYKGQSVLGDERESLALLKNGLALAGPGQSVRAVLDLQSSGKGALPTQLGEQMHSLPEQDQLWLVSRDGLPFVNTPMRSDVQSALSNVVNYITGAAAGIALDDGIHLQATLTCISPEGAQRVNNALRGGVAIGRLSTKENETDLLSLYDAVKVEQNASSVHVHADLSAGLADRLIQLIGRK